MGTRTHVSVTLLLTSTLTSGCIFGGGGKKPTAKAGHAATAAAADPSTAAGGRSGSRARGGVAATDAPEALLESALQPKDPAIKWLNPDALSLGSDEPVARRAPVPEPDAPAARTTVVPPVEARPEPQRAASLDAAEAGRPTGVAVAPQPYPRPATPATTPEAVANKGLDLADRSALTASGTATAATDEAVQVATPIGGTDLAHPAGEIPADLARRTSQRLRENPGDLSAHLDHQLLRFLSDETVPDLNTLSALQAEDRELLVALVDGLSNFRSNLRDDHNQLLSRKVRPLLEMAGRVRNQAELSIPTIALCQKVDGFGMYEPMDGRFVAGARNETLVYCEVANVSSQQDAQGWWESKLSQEAVLYKENGQRVWSNERVATPDRARNRRNDFFVAQRVMLPSNLSIDRYILKVTVLDEQVKRVAEATVPIQVVASLGPQQSSPLANPGPVAPAPAAPVPAEDRTGPDARTAGARQPAPAPAQRRGTAVAPAGSTPTANGQ